jgi:copper chaperone CopZ
MEHLNFKTNINCSSCVAKVTPFLNSNKSIEEWQVDTSTPDKILSIKGNKLSVKEINESVTKAGFKIFDKAHKPSSLFWSNKTNWKRAGFNTLNCLIGCSIGDFGTIIFLQYNYPEMSMWLMMGLAIIAGLITSIILETIILRVKEGFGWMLALSTAFSMSFISMLAMEISENMTDYFLTVGGSVPLSEPFYWIALCIALIAGFLVPLPYNYYKLQKHGIACH